MAAEELGIEPKILVHDRDPLFKHHFDAQLRARNVTPIRLPIHSPNLNAHCERMIRSIKEECLDHLIIFGIRRLEYVLDTYRKYFNTERPHQGLEQRTPEQVLKGIPLPDKIDPKDMGKIKVISHLGGLLKTYRWKDAA